MKRIVALLIAVLMVASLAAVGSVSALADSEETVEAQTIILANWSEAAQPESQALQYIADELEKRTDGLFTCEYYENGQLGKEQELYEQMTSGEIQFSVGSASAFDTYCPQLNPFSFPFIYPDKEACMKSLNGPIGQAINEELNKNNLMSVGFISRGNRQLTANKEIKTVEDVQGLRLRLPDIIYFTKVWAAMGANTMNINSTELFSALQTGVCDAQENPTTTNYNRNISEVQSYYMLTNHYVDFYTIFINHEWYESLPESYQQMVDEVVEEACDLGTSIVESNEAQYLKELEEDGMTIVEPEMDGFRAVAMEVLETVRGDWEDWVYDQMLVDTGLAE